MSVSISKLFLEVKIAIPCSAMLPFKIILSPILHFAGFISIPVSIIPIPAVLIKILSQLPFSTTFVSPVITLTLAFSVDDFIEKSIF